MCDEHAVVSSYRYDARERRRGEILSIVTAAGGLLAAAAVAILIHHGFPATPDGLYLLAGLYLVGLGALAPALVIVVPLHEGIHYAAWRAAGVPARFGWKRPATPYVRVADDRLVPATLLRRVLIAPLVVITVAGILLAIAAPPRVTTTALVLVAVNGAASVTDVRIHRFLYPHRGRQVVDRSDGFDVC